MLAGELPAAVLAAQCEIGGGVEHQLDAIIASPHKDTGRMPLQLTRQQLLLRGSMRRERPARSARTALRPLALPRRGRKRRGISGRRTVMTRK